MLKFVSRLAFFLFSLIVLPQAFSTEEILIEPRVNSPDSFYDQTVSLAEGSYSEVVTDLLLPGTVPLQVVRYYCSHDVYDLTSLGGWRFNSHCYLSIRQDVSKSSYQTEGRQYDPVSVFVGDKTGLMLMFPGWIHFGSSNQIQKLPFLPQKMVGTANTYTEEISGKTNLQNYELTFLDVEDTFILKTGNGTIRVYRKFSEEGSTYLLEKETLPSGNHILYDYFENGLLQAIKGVNACEEVVFSWISFSYPDRTTVIAEGSNQIQVIYQLESQEDSIVLASVKKTGKPTIFYEYDICKDAPRLKRKVIATDNFLEIKYFSSEGFQDGKVSSLIKPSIATGEPISHANFSYSPAFDSRGRLVSSSTIVKEFSGTKKHFFFNRDHRLEEMKLFLDGELYLKKINIWGGRKEPSFLLCEKLEDGSGTCLVSNTFSYDAAGNVLKRSLYGNLTGKGTPQIECNEVGIPISASEDGCLSTLFTYSSDGKNLLLSEEDSKGSIVRYDYMNETNLVASKLYYEKTNSYKAFKREFFDYDQFMNLSEIVIDDGKEKDKSYTYWVTQRFTTTIDYSHSCSSFGLPTEIVKTGWKETGSERVHRIVLDYDDFGNLKTQTFYGREDGSPKIKTFEYNKQNLLELFTDSEGTHETLTYDQLGRLQSHTDHLGGLVYTNTYGPQDTLIQEEVTSSLGKSLISSFTFDHQGYLVNRIDGFGRKTEYSYDPLGRLKELSLPAVKDHEGQVSCPVFDYEYDTLGNIVTIVDPEGYVEKQESTIRGQKTASDYSDGTFELFKYDQEGSVHRHLSREGVTRIFEYGTSGQLLRIEVNRTNKYNDSDFLFSCKYGNSQFFQKSSSDRLGEYNYSYSPTGNLSKILSSNKEEETDFVYGNFGEIDQTQRYYSFSPGDIRVEALERDGQGRITERSITDSEGRPLFRNKVSYSLSGDEVVFHHLIDDSNETSETVTFNPFGDLVQSVDAKGLTTYFATEIFSENEAQYLTRTATLPSQTVLEEVYDALDRIVEVSLRDQKDQLLKKVKFSYDLLGNLRLQQVADIVDGQVKEWQTTQWVFGPCNRLEARIENQGTCYQSRMNYEYDSLGRLHILQKEGDARTLTYNYNKTGFVKEIISKGEDQDIETSHTLTWNFRGWVTKAITKSVYESNVLSVERKVDDLGRVEWEEVSQGKFKYRISYTYDRLGRIKLITLPDRSEIEYEYDALYPRKVIRRDVSRKELGVHTFHKYDLSGNIQSESLPGFCGSRTYKYEKGTLTQIIESNFLQERLPDKTQLSTYTTETKFPFLDSSQTFVLDGENRIIEEKGEESVEYSYDSLGNILGKRGVPYIYNAPNQLIAAEGYEYAYSDTGNLKARTRHGSSEGFCFNGLDQLTRYISPNQSEVTYTYDAFGRRIKKKVCSEKNSTAETFYLYVGDIEIGSIDSLGIIRELRIPADPLDPNTKMVGYELGNIFLVPSYDLFGNLSSLVDPYTQEVVEAYSYSAYGEETIYDFEGYVIDQSEWNNPWGYQGKRKDPETGLIYFGHRYYAPRIGRFISPDPIFPQGSWDSPYQFCNGNPHSYKDLFGLEAESRDSEKFRNYFYGEIESHCYCERHRNCKRGSNLNGAEHWHATAMAIAQGGSLWLFDFIESQGGLAFHLIGKYTPAKQKFTTFVEDTFPIEQDEYYHSVYGKTTLALDVVSFIDLKSAVKAPFKLKRIVSKLVTQKKALKALNGKKTKDLPVQMHHFATNKHKIFTPQMEEIAKKFGLTLEGSWNKELMHHLGRHPHDYHEFVLFSMQKAEREAGKSTEKFLKLFEEYVKKPVLENPDLLNKTGWAN